MTNEKNEETSLSIRSIPLVISANTLRHADLDSRLAAAAGAGFAGIGLRLDDYRAARASGLSDARIVGKIEESGLVVTELETTWDWVSANDGSFVDDEQAELLRVSDLLRCRQINLPSFFAHPLGAIVKSFGRLCDRVSDSNLLIGLEFLPYGQISHLTFAWQVVADADRDNGGVLLDTWHYFRSGSQHEQLAAIPVEKIVAIQLNDVGRNAHADLRDEARHHRLLPGEGAGDLHGFLHTLDNSNYSGPIAVEVFSDALDEQSADQTALDSIRAVRSVLAAAEWRTQPPEPV